MVASGILHYKQNGFTLFPTKKNMSVYFSSFSSSSLFELDGVAPRRCDFFGLPVALL